MVLSGWMNSLYDRVIVFYVIILGDFFLGVGGGGVVWGIIFVKKYFCCCRFGNKIDGIYCIYEFFWVVC